MTSQLRHQCRVHNSCKNLYVPSSRLHVSYKTLQETEFEWKLTNRDEFSILNNKVAVLVIMNSQDAQHIHI